MTLFPDPARGVAARLVTSLVASLVASSSALAGEPAHPGIPPLPMGSQLLLVDGGVIAGRLAACDESSVMLESLDLGLVKLPREAVAGWRAALASDRTRSQKPVNLARYTIDERGRDRSPQPIAAILLDNDDVATSTSLAIDGPTATVAVSGRPDPVTIPTTRLRAVDFARARPQSRDRPRPEVTLVALRDGSRLAVARPAKPLGLGGSGRVRLALSAPEAGGLVIEAPGEAIVATADRGDRVRPLGPQMVSGHGGRDPGDLPIASYVPSRSLSGGPLRAGGENAFDGFSMQGPGKVNFDLRPRADRFEGRVALDDAAGEEVTVRITLRAGTLLKDDFATSEFGPIRGGAPPRAIAFDAPGMETLEIEVHADGDAWKQARVLWLDPVAK